MIRRRMLALWLLLRSGEPEPIAGDVGVVGGLAPCLDDRGAGRGSAASQRYRGDRCGEQRNSLHTAILAPNHHVVPEKR
jgi:hypothetical protein